MFISSRPVLRLCFWNRISAALAARRGRGIAGEVLTLGDGSMAPFDYKFAKAPRKIYRNQRLQAVLYGLLIREVFGVPVHRGFVCYTRSKYKVVEVQLNDRAFAQGRRAVADVLDVIQQGYLPQGTRRSARCADCCYRNICIQ